MESRAERVGSAAGTDGGRRPSSPRTRPCSSSGSATTSGRRPSSRSPTDSACPVSRCTGTSTSPDRPPPGPEGCDRPPSRTAGQPDRPSAAALPQAPGSSGDVGGSAGVGMGGRRRTARATEGANRLVTGAQRPSTERKAVPHHRVTGVALQDAPQVPAGDAVRRPGGQGTAHRARHRAVRPGGDVPCLKFPPPALGWTA
jgi:hypothetical protein